jgi:hypothetical protein
MTVPVLTGQLFREQPGGLWEYVSPSRLNLWLRCPLAFRLKYVEGIETPPSPSLFLGKMVHRGLEYYYRCRQLGLRPGPAEVRAYLETNWPEAVAQEGMTFGSSDAEAAPKRQAGDLVAAYLDWRPADEPAPLAVEAVMESPLVDPETGENLGIPLLGIVDLVLPEPPGGAEASGGLIVDFKTAARNGAAPEIVHEIQLTSYAYLYWDLYGQRESALEIRSLVKTKVPQVSSHRYPARTKALFRRLLAAIRAYLDDLDRGRFVYRPGMACSMCDFRESHCRRWEG